MVRKPWLNVAESLRRATVLSVGGSRDPKLSYQSFRGSDAAIEPLLERRGLTVG